MTLLALLVTLGSVQPATADSPSPSTAPVVRFLSYNMCGNSTETKDCSLTRELTERRKKVVGEARAWKADLVFLQEVCRQQYDAVDGALAADGYAGHFVSTLGRRPGLCEMGGATGDYGIAIFAKGAITGGTGVAIDPDDAYTSMYSGPEKWYAACVEASIQSIKTRACSVHLYPQYTKDSQGNPIPLDINARQAKNLAADPWLNADTPVVLGGDFNPVNRNGGGRAQSPRSSDLDPFYRPALGGTGRFIEVDETDSDFFDAGCKTDPLPASCRSGEFTHSSWSAGTEAKLDYIFVDAARFKNVAADAQPRDSRISDHYPYRGAATFSHCNNGVDGKADMLRRDAAGDLWRHFGRADGSLAADPCKVGAGWSIMNRIARAGDVDQDGDEDLYGIDSAGEL
ncbi:endonuclease/exonuclease/phosphatase family protein [Streptomyces bacillaris]|uniref:endonuclease/exonuclease/phosphatase family protein n=1 Tax=Streptomyces bacillaris TaxID=68179 RepID=UPI003466D6CA